MAARLRPLRRRRRRVAAVTRVDRRDWRYAPVARSPDRFAIIAVRTLDVPFCPTCVAQHRREAVGGAAVRAVVSLFSTAYVIPLLVACAALLAGLAPQGTALKGLPVSLPVTAAQRAAFAVAVVAFGMAIWYQTRWRRVPPPTSVTQSFDFSDNLSGWFETERRVYGMAHPRFAQAFAEVNHDRTADASRG